jgi:DnaJ-class molecular chaperone
MEERPDPYSTLNIGKDADDNQIKSACRKQRAYWHPDKNKHPDAARRFGEVTDAMELLLDKRKRALYDHGGWNYVDHANIISSTNQGSRKMQPINITKNVSLRELYLSEKITVDIPITEKSRGRTTNNIRQIHVPVDQIKYGITMVAENMGNIEEGCLDGDAHVMFLPEYDHTIDNFNVDDSDLVFEYNLTLGELLDGYQFSIRHPAGVISLQSQSVDPEGSTKIFRGYGLARKSSIFDRATRGNLVVKLNFDIKEQLQSLSMPDKKQLCRYLDKFPKLARRKNAVPSGALILESQTPDEYKQDIKDSNTGNHPLEMLFNALGGLGDHSFGPGGNPFGGGTEKVRGTTHFMVGGKEIDPNNFFK